MKRFKMLMCAAVCLMTYSCATLPVRDRKVVHPALPAPVVIDTADYR
jgi:hypothetical protein